MTGHPLSQKAARGGVRRRAFLQGAAALAGSAYFSGCVSRVSKSLGKKVIVIGLDGMDPALSASMMDEGLLPNLAKLRAGGGFSSLGTSVPPQSPVAWANFINGAGPGTHGIFDFVHRHPDEQCAPFFSAAETVAGEGGWTVGDYKLQLDFWPFQHKPPATELRRQGTPFWHYLDKARIPSTFYDLPCNYPPTESEYGYHRCIAGMGTPDLEGTYGTYQFFSEDAPIVSVEEGGGIRTRLFFSNDSARITLLGPRNSFHRADPPPRVNATVDLYRDTRADAALIDIQGRKILLKRGEWSPWARIDFPMPTATHTQHVSGICRFYLQQVSPVFRIYVSPINIDPSAPAVRMSEPHDFVQNVSNDIGLFYTTGFQEDHKARSNGIFDDHEFVRQATIVLEERLTLLEYAIQNYEDGLLFFYFSSSDLQSHILWWNSDDKHPIRAAGEARSNFEHIRQLYIKLDGVLGDLAQRYGSRATFIAMSDHGFANFGRQFNLNSWLRYNGYLGPPGCTSIMPPNDDVDWSYTYAYGLGINGLYVNLKGREREGIVEPGEQKEFVLENLIAGLKAVKDVNGQPVIRDVYRSDKEYSGPATALAPDLIVGYHRGYRASWATCLGAMTDEILLDNDSAWSADHCADALEVPGVFFSNRPLSSKSPSLVDVAPTILNEFGLSIPAQMVGKNIFSA